MDKSSVLVYLADINSFDENELYMQYKESFEKKRVDRIERCKNEKEKKRLICSGYALFKILSAFGITLSSIEYGEHGKPYIPSKEDFYFNMSHSGDYILIAVSGQEIGADIQKIVECKSTLRKRIVSEEEEDKISNLFVQENGDNTIFCWCLKESYTKLTGTGIGIDFKNITFYNEDEYLIILDCNEFSAYGKRLQGPVNYEMIITARDKFSISGIESI